MSQPLKDILDSALQLPEDDRARLVDALIPTLALEHRGFFDDALLAEIERRCDEFDAGRVQTFTWEEVKARARAKLNKHA